MKSLKSLPLLCVLLLPFSQFANADPISGSHLSGTPGASDQASIPKPAQGFRFDNAPTNSALFPLSSGTTEVNHLLSVTLETTPPSVAGPPPHARQASANGLELASTAGFEDPAMRSAIPSSSSAASFHVGASPAAAAVSLEPSSLILLGTGLICAAAVVLRRRRTV